MKTRSGFVSNSSSSSFVISANHPKFRTVAAIALYMIPFRGWEDDQQVIDRIHRQLELGMDANHPIAFQSCNYDTFICRQEDGEFYVSTCNNHDWDFTICDNNNWKCIDGVSMSHDDNEEHYILCEMPYLFKYFNASFNLTGWRYRQMDRDGHYSHEWCKDCITDLWVTDAAAPFCPKCGKRPEELDPFEVWLKKQDLAKVLSPENSHSEIAHRTATLMTDLARMAWKAGAKHSIEEG
jgi:hypothetical protein